ncbi:3-oxoacyl-[acyl-carrier-protein] synthase III C-terminal domain-containing protein [Streptomyces uncialis]|uniref:3-oxoacyl-ACP synthase n=1 Tax=Streptomyces uncialis TaxID=1048205 RepID=A0A1Q4V2V6_9ACTN|nr:3-oxoacyl-[acyl-carrier-protein] synthase III C-terminal domain-containing protein [Streptomyces uncialis]MCX4657948.1 3-oxoacyl-ACP synthase [Streptomyces uncialis]OKH92141.1 3-oxoacyl-ACP synthase [Streptomyces uncialis]
MAAPLAVRAAAWHLPQRHIDVAALPELAALDPARRTTCLALGIDRISADDGLDEVDLALDAARQALAESGVAAGELGALVVIESRAPRQLMASDATRLQDLLGAHRALTFSVGGLGCVSITPALLTARGLLAADHDLEHVLVVHGSKPATPTRYRHPVTVNGDAGQAVLLARTGPVRVLDVLQETNGAYWDLFHVPFRDRPVAEWREECRDTTMYSFRLALETRARLGVMLSRLLDRNGLRREDVRGFASQNLSAAGLAFVEEALDVSMLPACRDNLRRYGHLGPADVLLNLHTALRRGEVPDGGPVVLINVSPVAAWSLLLVATGEDHDHTYQL